MPTLPELRAQLIREQAEVQACDALLNAATPGTKEYGELRTRRQRLGLAVHATKALLTKAQTGHQPPLL